jgi:nucleotide-binding universal stress UspA family protein
MAIARHILVPTDFGPAAERALDMAVELAAKLDARITLLHVWSVPAASYTEGLSWPVTDIEREAKAALDEALEKLKRRHARSEAVLASGREWDAVLDAIGKRGVDLVVMGTHGRRGLARALLGSVAEKVVRLSPVPVLTVPERGA